MPNKKTSPDPESPPWRSVCPVACTLDIIGDRWTLLVIRDLFAGKTRFRDFARSPEGIATNILTNRLNRLLEYGLIEPFDDPEPPRRRAYRLSRQGESLRPVLQALADWGITHLEGTRIAIPPKM